MPLFTITPSAIAVLQHARVLAEATPDSWEAVGEAAKALHAPADAEIRASNFLSGALTCCADHGQAFELALQRARCQRLNLDLWLRDWAAQPRSAVSSLRICLKGDTHGR